MGTVIDLDRVRFAGAGAAAHLAAGHAAIARDSRLIARRMEAFDNVLGVIERDLLRASRGLGGAAAVLRATAARCRETVKAVEAIEAVMKDGDIASIELAVAKARLLIEGVT